MNVFIYALKCPIFGTPAYVGKSKNPKQRFKAHLRSKKNPRKVIWIQTLRTSGLQPELEILDEVSESEWRQWEIAYIEFFREQGLDLLNLTAGGQGISNPSETTREILRLQKLGEKNPNFGKKLPLETCEKISAAHKASPNSGAFKPGHKPAAETLLKKSAAMSGEKNPMFGKAPWLGRKHKPETLAKMSTARKLWHSLK